MTDFQYDIAFSFTKEDEGIATQINDLLQDRYRTFWYSKAQEKLAGTDGEDTFSAVFKEQAPLGRRAAPPRLGEHAVDQDRADRNQEQGIRLHLRLRDVHRDSARNTDPR